MRVWTSPWSWTTGRLLMSSWEILSTRLLSLLPWSRFCLMYPLSASGIFPTREPSTSSTWTLWTHSSSNWITFTILRSMYVLSNKNDGSSPLPVSLCLTFPPSKRVVRILIFWRIRQASVSRTICSICWRTSRRRQTFRYGCSGPQRMRLLDLPKGGPLAIQHTVQLLDQIRPQNGWGCMSPHSSLIH